MSAKHRRAAPAAPALPHLQTGKLRSASLGPTLTHIYETEGVRGLFRGNGAAVVRIVPYAAVHYWAYEHYRRVLVGAGVLGAQVRGGTSVVGLGAGSGRRSG